MGELAIGVLLALIPVSLFLTALLYLDSYKLVRFSRVTWLIGAGCLAAAVAWTVNARLISAVSSDTLRNLVAPSIEEIVKAVPVFALLRARRIGFMVDAAIAGFAVGAGFALVENLYYLWTVNDHSIALWVVRGFGTAIMHGGTTAIAAITAKVLCQRRDAERLRLMLPGLLVAVSIHSAFNHFLISPMASAALVSFALPLLLVVVFDRSEQYLRSWLGNGFDIAADLLDLIRSGNIAATPTGKYLQSVREHFDGPVVADMLCYLRLHTELSLRAKGMLILRERGLPVRRDAETAEKLTELQFLKKSIGRTGELALSPIMQASSTDLWQLQLLERELA